jgi:predicted nucleic acid-binding protein
MRDTPQLSIHDGFALALAEDNDGCILLTGDGTLRVLAASSGIEVHGVLWVIDQIYANGLATAQLLHAALLLFEQDTAVRLPARELISCIKRYERLR